LNLKGVQTVPALDLLSQFINPVVNLNKVDFAQLLFKQDIHSIEFCLNSVL